MVRSILSMVLATFLCSTMLEPVPRTNLFNPYDILLFKPIPEDQFLDFGFAYEGSYSSRSFQASLFEGENTFRREANVLQLWQSDQNFFAALRGTYDPAIAGEATLFNVEQHKTPHTLGVCGDLRTIANLMFSARMQLPYNVILAFYLPYLILELKDVQWNESTAGNTFTGRLDQYLNRIQEFGKFDLTSGWKRQGIGDLTALAWWTHNFPQYKEWLRNVWVEMRGGLIFPTGEREDINRLFGLALGNDGGVGVLGGGTLELTYGRFTHLGVDGQFTNFFGNTYERRFQTADAQTDLIFMDKGLVFKQPGFRQHYTLYLRFADMYDGLSTTFAYQHTRQHEDTLWFDNSLYDTRIANDAESLQDWTTHSFIWMLDYDLRYDPECSGFVPGVQFFAKTGFNGKRAVLFNTLGFSVNVSY